MLHLLLITLVPFTTMLIGRYPTLAPAVWFYAGNTIAFALVALRMVTLSEYRPSEERMIEDRIGLGMLIAASVTVILISFIEPKWACSVSSSMRWTNHCWLLRKKKIDA